MTKAQFELCGEKLFLLPDKAIFWPAKKSLIVSDVHLGKAGHFRKHGIPVSRKVHLHDLRTLGQLLHTHHPEQIILLGDLFHSSENREWEDFKAFMKVFDFVKFILVLGNHDILKDYPHELEVVEQLNIPPFCFTHERTDSQSYNLSGHIHPGFRLRSIARQGLTVPCFYFADDHGILPAFGQFTGIKKIRPSKGSKVFGVADDNVIELI